MYKRAIFAAQIGVPIIMHEVSFCIFIKTIWNYHYIKVFICKYKYFNFNIIMNLYFLEKEFYFY